jgi:[acyl-carrier-protein] S-malonyltransferase
MSRLLQEEMEAVIEVGPGRVLYGLMKKINRSVQAINVEDINGLKDLEKTC